MILAGVPIIVAVAFSLTPHTAQSSDAIAAEAVGHHVTVSHVSVSDATGVALAAGGGNQSAGLLPLVARSAEPDSGKRTPHTQEPTDKKTETTKPPSTSPTVQPTQTELPVTGGREVTLALAGGGLFLIGVLLLLLRRMARDH
jgi:Predicted solute binding protein